MTLPYNLTEFDAANNYPEMFAAINNLSDQILAMGLVIVIFAIVLVASKKSEEDLDDAILTAGAVSAFLSLISWGLQLVSWQFMAFWIAVLIGAFIKKSFN